VNYGILFEQVKDSDFPDGYWYAHVPSLGLTTHGLGIEGARTAALDLLSLWISEKTSNNEKVPEPGEFFFSTVAIPDDAIQSA
jgi:predicted RNase H-like HicB family nuclease